MIKLKILLEQVINEVGEIENIEPYSFNKEGNEFKFNTYDGLNVEVRFEKYNKDDAKFLGIEENSYNLIYNVEGDQTQHVKRDYSYLIKIITTIFNISVDWIKTHPSIKNITIFAGNKNKDKLLSVTDKQKENLYLVVFIKNRNKLNEDWWYKDLNLDKYYKGILFGNVKKIINLKIKNMNKNKYAVISLSGGMDSSTLLLRLLSENFQVVALSFDYGQKHKVELERATDLVKYINGNLSEDWNN